MVNYQSPRDPGHLIPSLTPLSWDAALGKSSGGAIGGRGLGGRGSARIVTLVSERLWGQIWSWEVDLKVLWLWV